MPNQPSPATAASPLESTPPAPGSMLSCAKAIWCCANSTTGGHGRPAHGGPDGGAHAIYLESTPELLHQTRRTPFG